MWRVQKGIREASRCLHKLNKAHSSKSGAKTRRHVLLLISTLQNPHHLFTWPQKVSASRVSTAGIKQTTTYLFTSRSTNLAKKK